MSGYTHQVNYSKKFLNGVCEGLIYHTYLRFCSQADADAFAAHEGEVFKACDGTGDRYRMEDAQVIDLADFA